MPIMLAHRLTRQLAKVRRNGALKFVRPDGKSQVSVVYENNKPVRVDTVVISTQHTPEVSYKNLRAGIIEEVVKKVVPSRLLTRQTKYLINPTGRFVVGGPHGDSGLTGRKLIVDTYGGMGRHGGGAFSGKIRRRLTEARPICVVMSPRTSWRPGSPSAAKFSVHTRLRC